MKFLESSVLLIVPHPNEHFQALLSFQNRQPNSFSLIPPPASQQTRNAIKKTRVKHCVHMEPIQEANLRPTTPIIITSIFLLGSQNKGFKGSRSAYCQRPFLSLMHPGIEAKITY